MFAELPGVPNSAGPDITGIETTIVLDGTGAGGLLLEASDLPLQTAHYCNGMQCASLRLYITWPLLGYTCSCAPSGFRQQPNKHDSEFQHRVDVFLLYSLTSAIFDPCSILWHKSRGYQKFHWFAPNQSRRKVGFVRKTKG